jgi:hypothetical protein
MSPFRLLPLCCLAVTMAMATHAPIEAQPGSPNTAFRQKVEDLLKTYIKHKGYPNVTPQQLEATMASDRLAVLHAIVWAGFLPLTPKPGATNVPAGAKVNDYIEAVYGIWGVRPKSDEGKLQFRLSVRLAQNAVAVLKSTNEFTHWWAFCHVLLPGDDDSAAPTSAQFAPGADCFRGKLAPRLQISYDENVHTIGEIDMDFDAGSCHGTPGNSDVRRYEHQNASHRHLDLLNQAYNNLGMSLSLSCQSSRFHCQDTYADPTCP